LAESRRLSTKRNKTQPRPVVFAQDTMSSSSVIFVVASLAVVSALVVQRTVDPFAHPEEAAVKMWEMEDQWNEIAVRFVKVAHAGCANTVGVCNTLADQMHNDRDAKQAEADFHKVCEPYSMDLMHKLGGVRATDSVNKYFKGVCYQMPKAHRGKREQLMWHRLVCAATHDKLVRRMLRQKTSLADEKVSEGLPTKDSEVAVDIAKESCNDLWLNYIAKAEDHVVKTKWESNWKLTPFELAQRWAHRDVENRGIPDPYKASGAHTNMKLEPRIR